MTTPSNYVTVKKKMDDVVSLRVGFKPLEIGHVLYCIIKSLK